MIQKAKIKYLDDHLREKISKQTGFKASQIKLIMSKRANDYIPDLNYHKFIYMDTTYILNKNVLKKVKH